MPNANTNDPTDQNTERNNDATSATTTRRAEGLRNALTSHPRSAIGVAARTTGRRVANPIHPRREGFSIRRQGHRISLHRVLTGFFGGNAPVTNPAPGHTRRDSSASDLQISRVNTQGSLQSLELISPGAFLFSGPSLRSACSSSVGYSASLIESQSSLGTVGNDSHMNVEDFPMRRITSEQPLPGVAGVGGLVEDGILEPFILCDITRSMSDVLLGIGSPIEELDDPVSEDLEDTNSPAVYPDTRVSATYSLPWMLPVSVLVRVSTYLDFQSVKAMKLTCRSWNSAVGITSPPTLSPPCKLPNELIQHIYSFLGPRDFNAARHTCQTWMTASLDRTILKSMLRRGGWWSGALSDLRHRKSKYDGTADSGGEEWLLSKRVARECALLCNWTGNGLETPTMNNAKYYEPLVEVGRTDFADLASGSAGPEGRHSGGLVFTVSVCGKLLLVADGGMIYVYHLQDGGLRPLTSIVCPRRVLAMSMDASAQRFAVAALLEGRMGLVCDLNVGSSSAPVDVAIPSGVGVNSEHHAHSHVSGATVFTSGLGGNDSSSSEGLASIFSTPTSASIDSIGVQAAAEQVDLQNADDHQSHERNHINRHWNILLRGGPSIENNDHNVRPIPIDNGTRSIYRHLCSDDDPPRCVSMCPQRRCVAFGCSAGIELYWVDALTGQNLNRWFPLTSPSDYLHFLPLRPGVDNAKKLRLISSAAHPSERPSICRRFLSNRPNPSLFWGDFGFESRAATHGRGAANSDHFHAVPMSDGCNVLFTDPATSRLYVGSDAPRGGPTKLLRTLMLMPPETDDIPRIYTAAADLTWGARIVVAFADRVVLYSVPPDVFAQECTDAYLPASIEGKEPDHWAHWLGKDEKLRLIHSYSYPSTNAIWPIGIKGTVIGTHDGLVDLAIYTEPELTIWAFGADGRAVTWQIDGGQRPLVVTERNVGRDGLVHEQHDVDVDGDVVMADAETGGERSVGFDGHDSALLQRLPGALHVDNDEFVNSIDVTSGEAWYDRDGDIVMFDAAAGARSWGAEDWLVYREFGNTNR